MKKLLIILILLIGNSLEGSSQTSSDTICFPYQEAVEVFIAAKQKKLADSLNAVLRLDISLLQLKVETYKQKDSVSGQIVSTYKDMVGNYQSQVAVLEKEVKKWQRKTTLTAIGGILLTGITTALFIFK